MTSTVSSSKTTTCVLLLLSLLSSMVSSQQICPLCATPTDLPVRWDYVIPDGRSCREVYLYVGGLSSTDSMCQPTKDAAQQFCCSATLPQGYAVQPTNPPVYSGPVGDEPICPICGTMEYPGIPQAFIVARYVGEYTCDQLYGRGLNGMTPDYMCGPLQDFAKPICGCGQYNPKCIADSSKCWGSSGSGSSPVAAPVQQPVQRPVSSPVSSDFSLYERKTPPEGGKYSTKLANNRGGAASTLRGGRRDEETGIVEEFDENTVEILEDFEFEARL